MNRPDATPPAAVGKSIWSRLLALTVSIGALILITRKVNGEVLWQTLSASEGRWWLLGLGSFGLGLVLQAWRWHQMLTVVSQAVSFRVSLAYTVIGHCFSALLFGALVSDVMKAGLYARRRGTGSSTILVASALDRFYGGISTAIYAAVTLWIGLSHGLHVAAGQGGWTWKAGPAVWGWASSLLAVTVVGAYASRSRWWPAWIRAWDQFGRGFGTLRSRPLLSLLLILAGVGVQLCISSVLALSLRAVVPTGTQLAWAELLWTFPAIGVVASLPITISGAGARDAAALWVWGMFGIAGAQCLSATLLTLTVNLAWALAGGLLLWTLGAPGSGDTTEQAPEKKPNPPVSSGTI